MNQDLIAAAIAQVMPLAVSTGLFVSVGSAYAPTPASGAISGTYSAVTGLQNIACMDAPETTDNPTIAAGEQKNMSETGSMGRRHVLLDAYYEQFSPATNWGDIGWRFTVDAVVYDIIGAECDSQRTQTRLRLRKVTT